MTVALLDACVLFPASLRDLFMRLAVSFVFQPKWTDRIHEEWISNLLETRPDLSQERLETTRNLMDKYGRDCLVVNYEHHIAGLVLPDEEDRHVLAAAIAGSAGTIVTYNLTDFPEENLSEYGIRALHPDTFLLELLESVTGAFVTSVKAHRSALVNPSKTPEEYLSSLRKLGLIRTVTRLQDFVDVI